MSHAVFLSGGTIEARLPGCWSRLKALEGFTGGCPLLACKHVVDGSGGMLCVLHPAAGMLCPSCTPHHVRRHGREVEFACDECHAIVDAIHGLAVECSPAGLVVRDTQGRRRPMLGRTWLVGCGVCEQCWTDSIQPAA